ncbi:MAG: hypothetical protein AB7K64_16210 [Variibacter sp.]
MTVPVSKIRFWRCIGFLFAVIDGRVHCTRGRQPTVSEWLNYGVCIKISTLYFRGGLLVFAENVSRHARFLGPWLTFDVPFARSANGSGAKPEPP